MKKLLFMICAMLLAGIQTMLAADACEHLKLSFDEEKGKVKITCNNCHQTINLKDKWEQKSKDFGVTVTDPYLDVTCDEHEIGNQQLVVTATSKIYEAMVIDTETNLLKVYQYAEQGKAQPLMQLTLPCMQWKCNITVLVHIEEPSTDNPQSTAPKDSVWVVKQMSYQPFHSLRSMTVKQEANADSIGLAHPRNKITVNVMTPFDEDAMSDDRFIVMRNKKPGLDGAEVVGSFDITQPNSTAIDKETGKQYGTYVIYDNDFEAQYNTENYDKGKEGNVISDAWYPYKDSTAIHDLDKVILNGFFTHPSQKVYYTVTRGIVASLWPDHRGAFCHTDSINSMVQLPSVSKVKIEKSDNWTKTKRSEIRITLDNPLPWEYNQLMDSAMVHKFLADNGIRYRRYVWNEKAKIVVRRYSPQESWGQTTDPAAATFVISGDKVKWNPVTCAYEAVFEDIQGLPYVYYYYTAEVQRGDSEIPLAENNNSATSSKQDAESCYSESAALLGNLTASRGQYPGGVLLKWDLSVGDVDDVIIYRRTYGDKEWEMLKRYTTPAKEYMDNTATAGKAFDYMVFTSCRVRNIHLDDSCKTTGWGSFRSSISGYLTMPNGTAMANQKVIIKRNTKVFISDVKDELGNVIMPGYHDGIVANAKPVMMNNVMPNNIDDGVVEYNKLFVDSVMTDEKGFFLFDRLLYEGTGTEYVITLPGSYLYGATAVQEMSFTLSQDVNVIKDKRFVYQDVATFNGRVLYSKSTVPVQGAYFVLNGTTVLRKADGDKVVTDGDGNFNFTIPAGRITSIKVTKDGHNFDRDGAIIIDNKEQFTPEAGQIYPISMLNDNTRVRLVGRICGGNVEAEKEVGFGKSNNNLGDNLTMVLQLDGNSTASLVYNIENPEDTEIKQTITHPYAGLHTSKTLETNVLHERKRITIHPDINSGEFFVDLIPARYKVSQLSADGYGSLYVSGEGFDVIDLSDSIAVKEMKSINGPSTFKYNATYVRPYHVPATVTYNQVQYGIERPLYGSETLEMKKTFSTETIDTVATYNEKTGETHYLFGRPVFEADKRYVMKAYVHEDFYYNNEPGQRLDRVPVAGGKLHVRNGLLSGTHKEVYDLDSQGTVSFQYRIGQPTFTIKDTLALRTMNISAEINNYFYDAAPLKGYVVGSRELDSNAVPALKLGGKVNILDVVCDPPGSKSYAYREKGTTYTWNAETLEVKDITLGVNFSIGPAGTTTLLGVLAASRVLKYSVAFNANLSIPLKRDRELTQGKYTMTLNERIQTSSSPLEAGAMADVYIGTTSSVPMYETEAYTILDSTAYRMLQDGIKSKAIRLISANKEEGKYLVVGTSLAIGSQIESTFAYTQRHILGVIIPELQSRIDALLVNGPEATDELNETYFKELSKATGNTYYVRKVNNPSEHLFITYDKNKADEVSVLEHSISEWQRVIRENEARKIQTFGVNGEKQENRQVYSIGGAVAIDYKENATAYYNHVSWTAPMTWTGGFSFGGNLKPGKGNGAQGGGAQGGEQGGNDQPAGGENAGGNDQPEQGNNQPAQQAPAQQGQPDNREQKISVSGVQVSFSVGPTFNFTPSSSTSFSKVESKGYGYHIETNDNSYMDIARYIAADITPSDLGIDQKQLEFIYAQKGDLGKGYQSVAKGHNYLFRTMGGAVHNPWYAVDSTFYHVEAKDAGKTRVRYPLGERLLKIDNPKISVDKTMVNNVPEDERAVFVVRMMNDTEVNPNSLYQIPQQFKLVVDEASNPNGVKIYIDGMPMADGKTITLGPGKSLTKTIEVERGVGYEFKDIVLRLRDASKTLYDSVRISVNYLPVATTVRIASPADKFILNTLSAKDKDGRYYLPVNITDYNVNDDGFHHIELQYKKETEGESQWTKVMGFYNDETLMAAATGDNMMIPSSGKIMNIPFYGEKDPIEMRYNLRAVAFRKLGTGFVTRESNIVTGLKDTRYPVVFGTPKPASGILTYADVISIPFNEPIAYNYLDKTANFQVVGYYNDSENDYSTMLNFSRTTSIFPTTKVDRSLAGNDFTVDAMVRLDKEYESDFNVLFSMFDTKQNGSATGLNSMNNGYAYFGVENKQLWFVLNGFVAKSAPVKDVSFTDAPVRVGMVFTQPENTGNNENQIKFLVGNKIVPIQEYVVGNVSHTLTDGEVIPENYHVRANVNAKINLGGPFVGDMSDVRLWARALSSIELLQNRNKRVNINSQGLMAYWPMDEGSGKVLKDEVGGADLYFTEQSWKSTKKQYSLMLKGEPLPLREIQEMYIPQSYDYTLSLWAKTDMAINDNYSLFRCGTKTATTEYFQIASEGGQLVLNTQGTEVAAITHDIAPAKSFADGLWHNIVVVANKTANNGALYFDGQMVKTLSNTDLSGLSETNIVLGDKGFHGYLDNLTVWNHAFPSNSIDMLYKRAATGHEMGLLLNIPFENTKLNSQGTPETVPSVENVVYKKNDVGGYAKLSPIFPDTIMTKVDDLMCSTTACPLKPATGIQNIPFSWTSTDNELQVNLLVNDSKINHQNVFVTVRGVEDLAGNVMQNPKLVSLYVDRCQLFWNDKKLVIDVPYLEDAVAKVSFRNTSGREIQYRLNKYASWLDINKGEGMISQLGEETVELSVQEGLAPGTYETILYLQDDNSLLSALPITVNVTATEPEWEITNDSTYQLRMNMTAQLKLTNKVGTEYLDLDKRDVVYAFCDNVCVGKAHVTVKEGNESYVYMHIVGSSGMLKGEKNPATGQPYSGKKITFRLWRAVTGNITTLGVKYLPTNNEVRFTKNSTVGKYSEPVVLYESALVTQRLSLKKGWNWVALNVIPTAKTVKELFNAGAPFVAGDIITTFEASGVATWVNGKWTDDSDKISVKRDNVYQIYANEDCTPIVEGSAFTDDTRYVTLTHKNGWNDLPYLYDKDMSLTKALADFKAGEKAVNGTVIMNRVGFAAVDNGKWYGSLETMHPGQGYYIFYLGDNPTTIHFYDNSPIASAKSLLSLGAAAAEPNEPVAMSAEHKSAMPVIAAFAEGVDVMDGDELVAYSEGEEVGRAAMQTLDDGRQRAFIMVASEQNRPITWSHQRNGNNLASARSAVQYQPMTVVGSINKPLVIDFCKGTTADTDVNYYTVGGIKVINMENTAEQILIDNNGQKILNKK